MDISHIKQIYFLENTEVSVGMFRAKVSHFLYMFTAEEFFH